MDQIPCSRNTCSDVPNGSTHSTTSSRKSNVSSSITESRAANSSQSSNSVISSDLQQREIEANDENIFLCNVLNLIDGITGVAESLRSKVENFSGTSIDDKEYIYLEEMLMRGTVELDNIDTRDNTLVRQERKKAVHYMQKLMQILDEKLKENRRSVVEIESICSDSEDDV